MKFLSFFYNKVRPFIENEIQLSAYPCLYCIPNEPQLVVGKDRHFTFDNVFNQSVTQVVVLRFIF